MENTLYIVWNDKSNIGISIIDEQHRGIVSSINSLHYFIKENLGDEALGPTVTILEQYTKLHFKTEERLITEACYPAVNEHIQLHENLRRKTEMLSKSSLLDKDKNVILTFLKNWWLNHINKEDRKYVPYVLKLIQK